MVVCLALCDVPSLNHYKMDSEPRGLCLIINIELFDDKKLPSRNGSYKDVGQFHVFFF